MIAKGLPDLKCCFAISRYLGSVKRLHVSHHYIDICEAIDTKLQLTLLVAGLEIPAYPPQIKGQRVVTPKLPGVMWQWPGGLGQE